MRTSRLYPPQMSSWATPGMRLNRWLTCSSSSVVTSTGSSSLAMPRIMIGKLLTSNLRICGRVTSSGSSSISLSSRDRTSVAAASISVPHMKVMRTRLLPSLDVLVSSSTPGMVAAIDSTISLTSRSITSGLAPSYSVWMVSVGISTGGSRSIRSCSKLASPSVTTMSVSIVVSTGRLTLRAGMFKRHPRRIPRRVHLRMRRPASKPSRRWPSARRG